MRHYCHACGKLLARLNKGPVCFACSAWLPVVSSPTADQVAYVRKQAKFEKVLATAVAEGRYQPEQLGSKELVVDRSECTAVSVPGVLSGACSGERDLPDHVALYMGFARLHWCGH